MYQSGQFGDLVDRLTGVTGAVSESYTFDDVGNRTASHLSSSYGYQSGQFNRLASTTSATYGFDANGNTTTKSEGSQFWRYGWDHENRLVTAGTRKQSVRYKYDALGRRIERNLGTGKERTKFTYDGNDVILDDNKGTVTKYLNGEGIDNKLTSRTGSTASYFLADHLGSTNGMADGSGSVTSSTTYDSFGNPSNTTFSSRYQFTGREFDSFSGLQFSRARFYDPKLGRFFSEDPIGLTGGINPYAYVSNGPINRTDPFGLYERDVHYYLTLYLALQNGCFGSSMAQQIAFGNQGTDDNSLTAPGYARNFENSYYHALNENAQPGVGSSQLLSG